MKRIFILFVMLFVISVLFIDCSEDEVTNPDNGDGDPVVNIMVNITSPADGGSFMEGDTISFAGSGEDHEGKDLPDSTLVWESDKDGGIGTGTSFDCDTLSVNTHLIILTGTDGHGNSSSDSVTVYVHTATNEPPVTNISYPLDGVSFTDGDNIHFIGSCEDPEDGTLEGDDLVWTSDRDGQIGIGTSFYRSDLSVNTHVIILTGTDSRGSSSSDTVTVYVNPFVNEPPVAYISSPSEGESFTDEENIYFSGFAEDPEDGILTGDNLVWTSDKDGQIGTGNSFYRDNLSINTHVISLTATDSYGYTGSYSITIYVTSGPSPGDYMLISVPATSGYPMGCEGRYSDEEPVHTVSLDEFSIGKYEVTYELWYNVRIWAESNGYVFENDGQGLSGSDVKDRHPVTKISWRDCIAWCNAYSEFKEFDPVYYTTSAQTTVYRNSLTGGDIGNDCVDWDANGFRLPTEAEWEYAARYIDGTSFSSCVEHSGYNIYRYIDDCAWFIENSENHTHLVGQLSPNSLGCYDMSGNVWEWCWDLYGEDYYDESPENNPRGPDEGDYHVLRGGSWGDRAEICRTAIRRRGYPTPGYLYYGVRICRGIAVQM